MFDLTLNRPSLASDLLGLSRRLYGSLRYGLVLLVWLGLFLVRPRLAIAAFKHRRLGSPIPRMRSRRTIGH
ncbi:MAG: hypothetical protein RLZZ141_446 [Pseudomonadota bacterium]|jgi:hypothetical protein